MSKKKWSLLISHVQTQFFIESPFQNVLLGPDLKKAKGRSILVQNEPVKAT